VGELLSQSDEIMIGDIQRVVSPGYRGASLLCPNQLKVLAHAESMNLNIYGEPYIPFKLSEKGM
jgi:hypothetical protein